MTMTKQEIDKLNSILDNQPCSLLNEEKVEKLNFIYQRELSKYDNILSQGSVMWVMSYAYALGRIDGIREQRAKKSQL